MRKGPGAGNTDFPRFSIPGPFYAGFRIRSVNKHADHFIMEFGIRLVTHGQIYPGFLVDNALAVGERREPGFSVVGAHAALTDTSEAHLRCRKVDDNVVDAAAAEGAVLQEHPDMAPVLGKNIEGKRFRLFSKHFRNSINLLEGQHRQHRPENLLPHDGVIPCNAIHHRGCNLLRFCIQLPSKGDFSLVNQSGYPVKMLLVNDFSIIRVIQRAAAELYCYLLFNLANQLVFHAALAENVIRSNTGLAAVQVFAKYNAACRKRNLGRFIHNAGTFPSELKCNGRQPVCRTPQDFPPNGLAAGKKYLVEMLVQKAAVFLPAAGDNRYLFRGEAFL